MSSKREWSAGGRQLPAGLCPAREGGLLALSWGGMGWGQERGPAASVGQDLGTA